MITTVAPAHLEAFESVDAIAREKASILEGLDAGGTAVLNTDIEQAGILAEVAARVGATAVGFGTKANEFRLDRVHVEGEWTIAQATARGAPLIFKVHSPGRHFAMNALGALAVTEALGADLGLAAQSLGRWTPYRGRGVRDVIWLDPVEPDLSLQLIDDAYNANPASMAAALQVLSDAEVRNDTGRVRKGRRIAFLGDMKELGPNAAQLHAALADLPAIAAIDKVHCIGPLMKHLHAALPAPKRGLWTETSADMVPGMGARLDSGDVVLAKGSLSMDLALIVDAIRKLGHAPPQEDE